MTSEFKMKYIVEVEGDINELNTALMAHNKHLIATFKCSKKAKKMSQEEIMQKIIEYQNKVPQIKVIKTESIPPVQCH